MTINKTNLPCYVPLNLISQADSEQVLYYNANAPLEDIYQCASSRLRAVMNLLEKLYGVPPMHAEALGAVAVISSILLNDAYTLLEEFNPTTLMLRTETVPQATNHVARVDNEPNSINNNDDS